MLKETEKIYRKISSGTQVSTISNKRRKKTIPKTIRNQVWRKHCGNMLDGKCFCCRQNIVYECWEAGHIIAESKGGKTTADNLRPLCIPCNRSMGNMNMFDFIEKYGFKNSH
jgi:5-methylcytosine-specific restriction endonuclease McrA